MSQGASKIIQLLAKKKMLGSGMSKVYGKAVKDGGDRN